MKTVTVSLEDDVYERLRRRAASLGVPLETAAGEAVRRDVGIGVLSPQAIAEERAAMERLLAHAATLPDIDVVELVRVSREDLEDRGGGSDDAAARKAQTLDALARLRELRKGLPPIDVVQLIREGRDELEERAFRR